MKNTKKTILIFILLISIFTLVFNAGYDIGYTYSLNEETTSNDETEEKDTSSNQSTEDVEDIEATSKKAESNEDKKSKKNYTAVKYISLIGICLIVAAMLFVTLSKEDSN